MAKQKVNMIDTAVAKEPEVVSVVTVTLVNFGPNDSIGEHNVFLGPSFGNIRFFDGKSKVSPEAAKMLKAGGWIK